MAREFQAGGAAWAARAWPFLKWSLYGLLGVNVVLFLVGQTLVEATDSLAWLMLLLLFEWETARRLSGAIGARIRMLLRSGRAAAYVVILLSAWEYSSAGYRAAEGDLDLWNAWTWIAITALLELDVRIGAEPARVLRSAAKALLYGTLFVCVLLWALAGELLDAWDASLWIFCFFVIELNVFRFDQAAAAENRQPCS